MENKQVNEKLMAAVITGDIEAATEAIIAGADIHQKTVKGNNLLYVAASRMQEDMFDWLLEVEVKDKKIDLNSKNTMGATTVLELLNENGGFSTYIDKILKAGANPNITSNDGMSPLIKACADAKLDEVTVLLDNKADVNYAIPDTKTTAFLMGASQGSFAICDLLVKNGADVNALDSQGKNALITAIYKTTRFMKKREKADHKALCLYLCDIGIDLDYVAPSGMTALWSASLNKMEEVVQFMLEKGVKADVWHEVGLEGKLSAMHIWAGTKEAEIVKKFHAAGGKLGMPDEQGNTVDAYGFMNPLMRETMLELNADVNSMYYIKANHPNEAPKRIPVLSNVINSGNKQAPLVKEMIARGAQVTFKDESLQQFEPIMMAIASSAYDIIDELLATKQIDLERAVKLNPNGAPMTPLMLAVSGTVNKNFSAFLEKKALYESIMKGKAENDKNGIKTAAIDEEGLKAIESELNDMKEIAAKLKEERETIYRTLIDNGANVDTVNEDNRSAIFFANGKDYASWLKNDGADLYLEDKDGNNPLVYAVLNNKKELIDFLKDAYTADKNETIDNIFYQLAFAPADSHMQQSLLEKGVINYISNEIDMEKLKEKDSTFNVRGINYQNEDGNSPLLVACANDLPFLASQYIRLGADINIKNANDETPLMHAIGTGNVQLVEFLIEKGADATAQTKEGKTVLEFAEEIKNKEILEKVKISLGHEVTEGSISGLKKIKP
jgi:ankyrin repeat protein